MQFSATGRLETTFVTETLETERCAACGIIFAIPTAFTKKRKEYGDTFYCPSGHHLSYGESEAAQERKKREEADGVRKIADGQIRSPEESHHAWSDLKINEGWRYGPVKDPAKREHPCLVPYDELPPEQRAKDRIFFVVVSSLLAIIPPVPEDAR